MAEHGNEPVVVEEITERLPVLDDQDRLLTSSTVLPLDGEAIRLGASTNDGLPLVVDHDYPLPGFRPEHARSCPEVQLVERIKVTDLRTLHALIGVLLYKERPAAE